MPNVSVPATDDPRGYTWQLAGEIGRHARAYSAAVYDEGTLPLRDFEAARMRIAQINGCRTCLAFRTATDHAGRGNLSANIPESFYAAVGTWATSEELSTRERLAAEFAERFALDHASFEGNTELWARLHDAFSDVELIELALSIASFMSFGRFARVFDVDAACEIPRAVSDARIASVSEAG